MSVLSAGIIESYDCTPAVPRTKFVNAVTGLATTPFTLTYGPAIAVPLASGRFFTVTITDNVAFAISVPTPTSGAGAAQAGDRLSIRARNASGGAHGAGTWTGGAGGFLAPAFPAIANGQSRTFEFEFNGTAWVQIRADADVPN